MAHSPESITRYICENCQSLHAGTPIYVSVGVHRFEPPTTCGACGETELVETGNWIQQQQ